MGNAETPPFDDTTDDVAVDVGDDHDYAHAHADDAGSAPRRGAALVALLVSRLGPELAAAVRGVVRRVADFAASVEHDFGRGPVGPEFSLSAGDAGSVAVHRRAEDLFAGHGIAVDLDADYDLAGFLRFTVISRDEQHEDDATAAE
jgi:hypothetical protein